VDVGVVALDFGATDQGLLAEWMLALLHSILAQQTKDYSLWRLFKMLFRLNFLVTMVLMTMNTDYMLYYICPMHTLWFLSV
jgi:hypothetical protein